MKYKLIIMMFFIGLLTLSPFFVLADQVSGTFTEPTMRADGSVLSPADIAGFQVYIDGSVLAGKDGVSKYTLPANASSFSVDVVPGEHILQLTTVDNDGRESSLSNQIVVVARSVPESPVLDTAVVVIINIGRP